MMIWQNRAWENQIRREFYSGEARLVIDHPHAARMFQIRNLVLVLGGGGLAGAEGISSTGMGLRGRTPGTIAGEGG